MGEDMSLSEVEKMLAIARLLSQNKAKQGAAAIICKRLRVSGKDIGKVAQLIKKGAIAYINNEPEFVIPLQELHKFLLGDLLVEWSIERGLNPEEESTMYKFLEDLKPFLFKKRGRPKGSSLKSHVSIINTLTRYGQLSYEKIVSESRLHRNTVSKALKELANWRVLDKERCGRNVLYSINPRGFLLYPRILALHNRRIMRGLENLQRKQKRYLVPFIRDLFKYLPEIMELKPNFQKRKLIEIVKFARELYAVKQLKKWKSISDWKGPSPTKKYIMPKEWANIAEKFCKDILKKLVESEYWKNVILLNKKRWRMSIHKMDF